MTEAEKLRQEILKASAIDKQKVLESVRSGIKRNGECLVYEPYNPPKTTIYNSGSIEVGALEDETAIKEFVLSQGFRIKRAYHPVSGRAYGFYVIL